MTDTQTNGAETGPLGGARFSYMYTRKPLLNTINKLHTIQLYVSTFISKLYAIKHHLKNHNGNKGLPMFMLSLVLCAW